jgi:hypothetical protein
MTSRPKGARRAATPGNRLAVSLPAIYRKQERRWLCAARTAARPIGAWPAAVGYIPAVAAPVVTSRVATSYVRDLLRSRAFYAAIGPTEASAGGNDLAA